MTCRVENHSSIDNSQRVVHAQPQPFEYGREMPGVYELTIDRGLSPHRFEPDAIHEGWQQGMPVKGLIQPGDGPRSALQGPRECGIHSDPRAIGLACSLIGHGPLRAGSGARHCCGSAAADTSRVINSLNIRQRQLVRTINVLSPLPSPWPATANRR